MNGRLIVSAAAMVLVAVLPADAQYRGRGQQRKAAFRFQEMDRNNDGVIARSEWQGSDQSFRTHDWNNDGVLSGDEVRLGAVPPTPPPAPDDQTIDANGRVSRFDDWTARGFDSLDHNRDGRVARDEWHFDPATFRRADHDNDGALSRAEFLATDALDDDRTDRFIDLDTDRNGQLSRAEWHGAQPLFNAMDANKDGVVTRVEMSGTILAPELFPSVDVNRDGAIALNEWHWSRAEFERRDLNHDTRLTRVEFDGPGGGLKSGVQSGAYKAGFERGDAEGRAQAREDRVRNQGYDAEGQRELETADSGYESRLGPKPDYQAGYRAGWRRGYPEGWGQKN